MTTLFRGLPAAPGVGIGQLFIYRTWHLAALTTTSGPAADPDHEWQRFRAAQQAVDDELAELIQADNSLIADIFASQRVILHDQTLVQAMREAIFQERQPVLNATQLVINHLADLFRNLGDDYLAGRAIDILDIGQRLLKQMDASVIDPQPGRQVPAGAIIIARDLTFSEITQLPFAHIAGIALAESTPTAHSAILARSLGIPLVCTLGEGILLLAPSQSAIVDGHDGYLLVAPSANDLTDHQVKRQAEAADRIFAEAHAHELAYTRDGLLVSVLANANNPEDITQAQAHGADGIGLLRTEYLFQNRIDPPTYEEQVGTYRYFIEQMAGRQLTVRALDIGGDKPMPYLLYGHEANPFLGLRGIRLLLAKPELLVTQYCALWQAAIDSCVTELRFMLPMISTVEEVRAVRELLTEAVPANQSTMIKIGVMIEVPSAALIADRLAPLVDFFSIGTNDLAQYTLATDRTNSSVAALADPLHPAVLRLIQLTCQAGAAHNIPVSICGEIGGDPQAVPLLLGLGLNELSVPVLAAPLVKEAVRRSTQADCRLLAAQALACPDSSAVRALLE